VLELEDLEDRPLDVDVVAVLELVRRDRTNQSLLQVKIGVIDMLATTRQAVFGRSARLSTITGKPFSPSRITNSAAGASSTPGTLDSGV
jgi:hypothetical protein